MQAIRDARDLHADLKRTASLELLHQQQVEADGRQNNVQPSDIGLGASFSSAISRMQLARKNSKGKQQIPCRLYFRMLEQDLA